MIRHGLEYQCLEIDDLFSRDLRCPEREQPSCLRFERDSPDRQRVKVLGVGFRPRDAIVFGAL